MRAFQIVCMLAILSSNCRAGEKVVDLILVAGQSNAVGFHTRASELPRDPSDHKVMFWWKCGDPPADEFDSSSNQEWTTLKPQPKGKPKLPKRGMNYGNFACDEGGFGPEIGLARTLLERQPDRPLAIVKVAVDDWGCEVVNVAHFGSTGTLELGKRYANSLITTEERMNESKKK